MWRYRLTFLAPACLNLAPREERRSTDDYCVMIERGELVRIDADSRQKIIDALAQFFRPHNEKIASPIPCVLFTWAPDGAEHRDAMWITVRADIALCPGGIAPETRT